MQILQDNAVTIAATQAALFSILIGYPFDSVKTRLQSIKYPTITTAILSTLEREGIRGFYRGVVPLLASTTVLRAVSWNIYTSNKLKLNQFGIFPQAFIAGGATGVVMSVFAAPMEFIKVQRQLQSQILMQSQFKVPNNLYEWIKFIYSKRGFRGFYSGYSLHAPVDVLGTGFYFGIYESIKHFGSVNGLNMNLLPLIAGALSGSLSWILVFPFDVVKSLYQKQVLITNTSISKLIQSRYREMGLLGFYRGLSMQLVRSVPVHSINFFVYEQVYRYCTS